MQDITQHATNRKNLHVHKSTTLCQWKQNEVIFHIYTFCLFLTRQQIFHWIIVKIQPKNFQLIAN